MRALWHVARSNPTALGLLVGDDAEVRGHAMWDRLLPLLERVVATMVATLHDDRLSR
jgi:hypothetical protein